MPTKEVSSTLIFVFSLAMVMIACLNTSHAAGSRPFRSPTMLDGATPESNLIADAEGNFYGTTYYEGADNSGYGTVFKLSPASGGKWKESILHRFAGYPNDGAYPSAGLVFDTAGNLYGTTKIGGNQCSAVGCGTVFKLSPGSNGKWKESILYSFGSSGDGIFPYAGLIFDAAGNLYGTTSESQGYQDGTVFQLIPHSHRQWTEKILYTFTGNSDGGFPLAGLVFDREGNLYGTTFYGGDLNDCENAGCGTVFELENAGGGAWTEKVLHFFTGNDGQYPMASVIFDSAGDLYGAATGGPGIACGGGCGTVFKLAPDAYGSWTYTNLYIFEGGPDGNYPAAGLVFDKSGSLYGITELGGSPSGCGSSGCGTVFSLTAGSNGRWREKVLHRFDDLHGNYPAASLLVDHAGNLYGTTQSGGSSSCECGTVFKLTHTAGGRWITSLVHAFGSGKASSDETISTRRKGSAALHILGGNEK